MEDGAYGSLDISEAVIYIFKVYILPYAKGSERLVISKQPTGNTPNTTQETRGLPVHKEEERLNFCNRNGKECKIQAFLSWAKFKGEPKG